MATDSRALLVLRCHAWSMALDLRGGQSGCLVIVRRARWGTPPVFGVSGGFHTGSCEQSVDSLVGCDRRRATLRRRTAVSGRPLRAPWPNASGPGDCDPLR